MNPKRKMEAGENRVAGALLIAAREFTFSPNSSPPQRGRNPPFTVYTYHFIKGNLGVAGAGRSCSGST